MDERHAHVFLLEDTRKNIYSGFQWLETRNGPKVGGGVSAHPCGTCVHREAGTYEPERILSSTRQVIEAPQQRGKEARRETARALATPRHSVEIPEGTTISVGLS